MQVGEHNERTYTKARSLIKPWEDIDMAQKRSTRAAQGAGTIRQRKDGRWEARYTLGRDPGTGKQMQKSVYGATQQEVRKKLSQAVAALDKGDYFEPAKTPLGEWLDIWLTE